jgi:hypothetical protein
VFVCTQLVGIRRGVWEINLAHFLSPRLIE